MALRCFQDCLVCPKNRFTRAGLAPYVCSRTRDRHHARTQAIQQAAATVAALRQRGPAASVDFNDRNINDPREGDDDSNDVRQYYFTILM
jgi:hypothetical protein